MSDRSYTPELIADAIRGDDAALSFLYESTQDKVTQTVRSMIRDEDAVLDIVQDSFVKAFRNLDKLDKPEYFLAWMRRIATNTAVDYMKKKRPVLFSELASEDGTEIEFEDENIGHLPDVLLDQQETSRLIQEIVCGLSEEQQLAIGLFYFEEMPIKSIAKKLGCSENTVKSRLNYGRKNIEKQVRELEKKGTKLYSLAPLPFFLWLLRNLHAAPSQDMLGAVLTECADLSSGAAATANHTAAKMGAKATSGAVKAGGKAASSAAKKLTTKIVAGILAVATIGGGAAIALSGGSGDPTPTQDVVAQTTEATEAQQPVETTVPTTEPPVDPTPAYQTILDEYTAACGDPDYLEHRENYPNTINDGMYYYHAFGPSDLYYAFHDIDGNGVYELLIGTSGTIWDAYAFDGETPFKLVNIEALGGGRSSLTIMDSGELYITGASGADDVAYYMLRIGADGFSTESVFYFTYEYSEFGSSYQGMDGTEHIVLTEDEFNKKLSSYSEAYINWEMLVEAPMTATEAYKVILDEYTAAAQAVEEGTYSPEQYPHTNNGAMHNVHNADGVHFLYAFCDVDRNGTNELIISYVNENRNEFTDGAPGEPCVIDVYTYDGTQAVQLFPDRTLGDTAALKLVNDGELYFVDDRQEGGRYILARIAPDGYSLEVLCSYQTRLEDGEVIYYNDTESYTEFEFRWAFPPLYFNNDIGWTSLAAYSD